MLVNYLLLERYYIKIMQLQYAISVSLLQSFSLSSLPRSIKSSSVCPIAEFYKKRGEMCKLTSVPLFFTASAFSCNDITTSLA